DCKRLPLPTVTWFCLCRRQGGPTTFPPTTSNTTEHYGTISTGPFRPEGQPASVQTREPEPVNILTAMPENQGTLANENDPGRKAIAVAWLFHLVGDVHQPLHTAQLFTVEYPQGDRGGNEICVRVTEAGQPMDLYRFWDGVITSSQNLTRLRKAAQEMREKRGFS